MRVKSVLSGSLAATTGAPTASRMSASPMTPHTAANGLRLMNIRTVSTYLFLLAFTLSRTATDSIGTLA